ncbi:hypothetical protein V5E97_00700 [Singulisphaera sp. Ch08]|uniref:Uncharacterized protein n=1 Tax=Singulisphaera sp. Ch08 TaxID=3120278 RepID=A0AAU7CUT1_9BACT
MDAQPKSSNREEPKPAERVRPASATQILNLLNQCPMDVYKALGLDPAETQLSMPTDGRGARIRASVKRGEAVSVPTRITLTHDNRRLSVPVEVDTDFQDFRPL